MSNNRKGSKSTKRHNYKKEDENESPQMYEFDEPQNKGNMNKSRDPDSERPFYQKRPNYKKGSRTTSSGLERSRN